MKKMISLLMAFTLFCSLILPVSATGEVQPRYTYVIQVNADLTFDSAQNIATCTGAIAARGQLPVRLLVQLQVLENGNWKPINSRIATGTGMAYSSANYSVTGGNNYRLVVTGQVLDSDGNVIETVSANREAYYPAS